MTVVEIEQQLPGLNQHPQKNRKRLLPPLENGDRLTRTEFERRYQSMPRLNKAELIEGVVYMPSPVHQKGHSQPHAQVVTWLGIYHAATSGTDIGDNATVRLDLDNEPQPDALLRIDVEPLRKSYIDQDDFIHGAPELVVEIAGTSASYDLHQKLNVYRRNGVQEYIVWLVYDQIITWFHLDAEIYTPLTADEHGIIHSRVFPGLWLAPQALLAGDLATVLATLQQGLQSAEHSEFVKYLAQAQSGATV
jgi:Uma2 family endonuclease